MFPLLHRPFRAPSHLAALISSLVNGWSPVREQSDASLYLGSRQEPGSRKVWLQQTGNADGAASMSTLWYGQVWASPPDHILVLHHVAHWERKSCGEEKKRLVHPLFMPSQWWSMARSCQCHGNTALVTTSQRNNSSVVKLLLELVWGWPGPGKGSRKGLPAAAGSPLEGTAVVQERSEGLRERETTWFIVMWLH